MTAALFAQLAIILAAARAGGAAFRRIGQPRVCGEIAAGLALGPSLVGRFAPSLHAAVFAPAAAPIFRALSDIGLVLLMFLVGLQLHADEVRTRKRAACIISVAGVVIPFACGVALAELLRHGLVIPGDRLGFMLFVGTAISITAIPTLARILDDLNLQRTRIGALATTAAALDDVVGWTLLAGVTALARSQFIWLHAAARIAAAIVFAWVMTRAVRPIVARWCARVTADEPFKGGGALTSAIVVLLLAATATSAIGLSGIFGGFSAGIALSADARLRRALVSRLQPITLALFLPIFFTYTGLRTDVGSVQGSWSWLLCALVIAVGIAGKVGGCTLAAWMSGFAAADAWSIGILMNTRGMMELVVVNVGYDLGVIPRSVFFMLVAMAVVTTCMTMPLVRCVLRGHELDPLFAGASARSAHPLPAA